MSTNETSMPHYQSNPGRHRVGKGRGERELGSRARSKRSVSCATDEARPFRHPLRRQVEEEVELPQKGSACGRPRRGIEVSAVRLDTRVDPPAEEVLVREGAGATWRRRR